MTNSVNTKSHTDIKKLLWIENILPESFHPFAYLMRLDRPVGIWLLLLPGLWSIMLASGGLFQITWRGFFATLLFIIGAVIMRGAGCVINDIWDRELDKKVERTKNRPLASGQITTTHAAIFLCALLLIGFAILLQFNATTIVLGFCVLPLIIAYPLMKRITWWPQAFLGLTFNFSALMGWSAITGSLSLSALCLYAAGICWTLGYDTIYAHQDKEDDIFAGIKSTALKFGAHSKAWVGAFYAGSIMLILMALLLAEESSALNYALVIAPSLHMIWQLITWKTNNQDSALKTFKANTSAGLLILCALIL